MKKTWRFFLAFILGGGVDKGLNFDFQKLILFAKLVNCSLKSKNLNDNPGLVGKDWQSPKVWVPWFDRGGPKYDREYVTYQKSLNFGVEFLNFLVFDTQLAS